MSMLLRLASDEGILPAMLDECYMRIGQGSSLLMFVEGKGKAERLPVHYLYQNWSFVGFRGHQVLTTDHTKINEAQSLSLLK